MAPIKQESYEKILQGSEKSKWGAMVPNKDASFYFETYIPNDGVREMFSNVGTMDKLLQAHVKKMQLKAWSMFPYPCIGMFEFTQFNLPLYPKYYELLATLRAGGRYLDVGCCVGQDVRYLYAQGDIPAENLYAADLKQEFIDMGYELFMDRKTFRARIEPADLFDDQCWINQELAGQMDVIHASYFLHLFEYDTQLSAAIKLVHLLKAQRGSKIVGRSVGSTIPNTYIHPTVGAMYRHSYETFEAFWLEVGDATGTELELTATIHDTARVSVDGKVFDHPPEENAIDIRFCVTVISSRRI